MKCSICLATYNGEKYIQELLNSILCQIDINDEIIVSDDYSTDNTLTIIRSFNDFRIKIFMNQGKRGVVNNFGNALKYASGDYIFLCDQDDVWFSNKKNICISYLDDADLIVTDCSVTDKDLNIIYPSLFEIGNPGSGFWKNWYKNTYVGANICFKRKLLDIVLPIPSILPVYHEGWIASLADIVGVVKFVPITCLYYRRHDNNTSCTLSGKGLPIMRKIYNRVLLLLLVMCRLLRYYIHR